MQVNFTRGEKKLLKGLKTEYFHFIIDRDNEERMKFEEEEEKYKLMKMVEIEDDNRESNHLVSKQ